MATPPKTRWWTCIPCGADNGGLDFCHMCGRKRDVATDATRWQRFFMDAVIVPKRSDDDTLPTTDPEDHR